MIAFSIGALGVLLKVLVTLALPLLLIIVAVRVVVSIIGLVFRVLRRGGGFIGLELRELMHTVAAFVTASVTGVLALCNGLIWRIPTMRHYGRALQGELASGAGSLYRLCFGHPARLVGLDNFAQDLERRVPELIRNPLAASRSTTGSESFPGYRIVGTIPAGGSGARLYLAVPLEETTRRWASAGLTNPGQVVIKSFTLEQGSTVPQIVRESKALEAARRLGRVLDHHLASSSFWYAMPFVPGENLDVVVRRMHARCGDEGLDRQAMARVMGYARDMLATLHEFHDGGLWHKDIKPSNLIVSSDRVHLVDLGLVTPLASAMTLTTHGTEYYRDPELVRLAMKGVRVHEVNGAKFDLYSAGAVIYSMVEDGFPAQGSLSSIRKTCPEALAWIVRRSMADVDRRYESALEMATDLDVLLAAADPFTVKPADLPSMNGESSAAGAGGGAQWLGAAPQPHSSVAPPPSPFSTHRKARFASRKNGSRKGFRVIRAGLVAAVMLGLLSMLGATMALRSQSSHSAHAGVITVSDSGSQRGSGRTVRILAPSSPKPVATRKERSTKSRLASLREDIKRALSLPPDKPMLFLVGAGVDSTAPQVGQVARELREAGIRITGQPGDTDEDSIEWLAQARLAVELGEPSDPKARERVREFLNSEGRDLMGVVWFTPGDRRGEVIHQVLLSDR